MGTEQRLVGVRALARHIRRRFGAVDAGHLRREAMAGRIPSTALGGILLFDVQAVEAALLERAARERVRRGRK